MRNLLKVDNAFNLVFKVQLTLDDQFQDRMELKILRNQQKLLSLVTNYRFRGTPSPFRIVRESGQRVCNCYMLF